jgi:hypothetical protein
VFYSHILCKMNNKETIFDFAKEGKLGGLRSHQGKVDIVDQCKLSPLYYAVGHIKRMKYLVDVRGANVNGASGQDCSPLSRAIRIGDMRCVKFLVRRGAHCDYALQIAAMKGNLECLQYLVEMGADVNQYDGNRLGPIHRAAEFGHLDCLAYLVEKGANLSALTIAYTPLSLAVSTGHVECAKLLVANGANINGKPSHNCIPSPLSRAKQNGDLSMIKWLLSQGASPFNDVMLARSDNSSIIFIARKSFVERMAIQTMMSMKTHPRLGQTSLLQMIPSEIIRVLHSYFV